MTSSSNMWTKDTSMCCLATITYLLRRKDLNPFCRIRVFLRMSIFWHLQVGCTAFLSFLSLDREEVLKCPEWLSEPHKESKMSWTFPLPTRKIQLLTLKGSYYACLMITTPSEVCPSAYEWLMFVLIDFSLPERELWQGAYFSSCEEWIRSKTPEFLSKYPWGWWVSDNTWEILRLNIWVTYGVCYLPAW